MAYLGRVLKAQLVDLCDDLGVQIDESWIKGEIISAITSMNGYSEELVKNSLEAIQEAREEKERERREAREEKEKEKERAFELEKLRIEKGFTSRSSTPQPQENVSRRQYPEIRKLVPKFNADETDISLFLTIFERQLRSFQIEEEVWTSQLLSVLPLEVGQIILQESGEDLPDYSTAKQMLLDRFRLTPEAFRQKFVTHVKKGTARWKDFAYELQGYLEGWLKGLNISTFDQVKNLMVADQLKRKAGVEAKTQFIDIWSEIVSPWALAEKLDHFELVRPGMRKTNPSGKENFRSAKTFELTQRSGESKKQENIGEKARNVAEESGNQSSVPSKENRLPGERNPDFDKRKPRQCFICNSEQHFKINCPYRERKDEKRVEEVNQLRLVSEVDQDFEPYTSTAKVNGVLATVLRDTGASTDVVSRKYVDPSRFTGESVWVKQPLDIYPKYLPVARITLEGDFGQVTTKAVVVGKALNTGRYLMGNRTAALIEGIKQKKPQEIKAISQAQVQLKEIQPEDTTGKDSAEYDSAEKEPDEGGRLKPKLELGRAKRPLNINRREERDTQCRDAKKGERQGLTEERTREFANPSGRPARKRNRNRKKGTRRKTFSSEIPGNSRVPRKEGNYFGDSGGG